MKVLHTIEGMGAKFGGIATCTYDLISALNTGGTKVDLLSPSLKDSSDRLLGKNEAWNMTYQNDGLGPFNYSRNLEKWLAESEYDVYHANGMWQFIVHETSAYARKQKKPYVITPHGMLYPETLARSAWKKNIMRKIWFDNDIKKASCIHVTCRAELEHLRTFGYEGKIALIGNPVNIPDYTEEMFRNKISRTSYSHKVGFLGRLHPRKKAENLISGLAKSERKDTHAYIIGEGEGDYVDFLNQESRRLGIADRVHFMGFLNGKDKFDQLADLDALFVPSDMENFGMIIPEAMIVGTPVMASLGTPWEILNREKCGWWRDNSPESIARTIDQLYSIPIDEYHNMVEKGRKLIIDSYSSKYIASQMSELYCWLTGHCQKPLFIDD